MTGRKIEVERGAEIIGNTVTEEATEETPKGALTVDPNGTSTPNKLTNEQQQVLANNRWDTTGMRIAIEIKENPKAQEEEDTPTTDATTADSKTSRKGVIHNRRITN